MTNSNALEKIITQADQEQWPYPKQFQALKDAGVTSYEIKIADFDAMYHTGLGTWKRPAPEDFSNLTINTTFNKQAFLDALERRMKKETSYVEFLGQIAAAGIARYVVSMADRTVTYYGTNPNDFHVQHVPQIA